MFLDLWSLAILTGDLLELIVSHIESGTLFVSLPFLVFIVVFGTVSAFAWRSTHIPDLPPVPRPPYVIQISSTPSPVNINGERNGLADVRLLSTGADVDSVLRRFPHQGVNQIQFTGATISNTPTNLRSGGGTTSRTNIRIYPQQQAQRQDGVLLGLLRPSSVIRPFTHRATGGTNQAQNLIVYHRVNVYHHHHHHHHPEGGPQAASSGSASVSSDQSQAEPVTLTPAPYSRSVDSSTQYETNDASNTNVNVELNSPDGIANSVEIEVSPINIDLNPGGEEITIQSTTDHSTSISSETSSEGLRQGRAAGESSESSSDMNASENSDNHLHPTNEMSKSETDQPSGPGHQEQGTTTTSATPEDDIKFTIKFLNDTQMEVTSQAGEKIADFKRRTFATELSENKTVRLIFNGRVLSDTITLRQSGVFDQCVVHCLVISPTTDSSGSTSNQNQSTQNRNPVIRGNPDVMGSYFFVSIISILLIILWFICFNFGHQLFSQSAVISLTLLTGLFLIGLVSVYLPVHPNPNPTQ